MEFLCMARISLTLFLRDFLFSNTELESDLMLFVERNKCVTYPAWQSDLVCVHLCVLLSTTTGTQPPAAAAARFIQPMKAQWNIEWRKWVGKVRVVSTVVRSKHSLLQRLCVLNCDAVPFLWLNFFKVRNFLHILHLYHFTDRQTAAIKEKRWDKK